MRGLPPNPLLTQFRKLQPSPLEVGDHSCYIFISLKGKKQSLPDQQSLGSLRRIYHAIKSIVWILFKIINALLCEI